MMDRVGIVIGVLVIYLIVAHFAEMGAGHES